MKILPYKKLSIKHHKSKNEIYELINNSTEACRLFGNRGSSNFFCGECHEDGFKIRRIIEYRNSVLPLIIGKIDDEEVHLTIRMHHFMNVFLSIWMAVAILAFVFFGFLWMISEEVDFLFVLMALVLIIFGFIMLKFGFWTEVEKAESELKRLINS